MKPEYAEGREVAEKFKEAMKILLRSPKPKIERRQPMTATSTKPKKTDKD